MYENQFKDDGTRMAKLYDYDNTKTWTSVIDNYSASGALLNELLENHDNSRSDTACDALNAFNWAQDAQIFDPNSRLNHHFLVMDDGTTVILI